MVRHPLAAGGGLTGCPHVLGTGGRHRTIAEMVVKIASHRLPRDLFSASRTRGPEWLESYCHRVNAGPSP
eukprot:2845985-Pyramimonas_sp.AAC.1